MDPAAAIRTSIPCRRGLALCAKALAVSFALLFPQTQPGFAASCADLKDTLARLRCFDYAADVRLPLPKGAVRPGQQSREQRIRKFGGQVSGGQVSGGQASK
jgi:hypothetical protein